MRPARAADRACRWSRRRNPAAVRDRRRPRRQLHRVHADGLGAAVRARPAARHAAGHRDRAALRRRRDAARAADRDGDRGAVRAAEPRAEQRSRRRFRARRLPRARVRSVRGPGARDRERAGGAAPDRVRPRPADTLLRGRRGFGAAALRARRPARGATGARDPRLVASRARRGDGGGGARDRVQPRPDAPDPARLVHECAAAAHRGVGLRGAPSRLAARRRRNAESPEDGVGLEDGSARLRRRARDHRHRALAEHAGRHAAHARRPARQGRARRLLDVLVHQLPAHAAASAVVVRRVPQGRLRHHRRAHARVRVRARARQRRGRREAAARDVAGRARQRLRDVDGILERVLAR